MLIILIYAIIILSLTKAAFPADISSISNKILNIDFIGNICIFVILGLLISLTICMILFYADSRKQIKILNEKINQKNEI